MASKPSQSLDTFPNPQPGRDYTIRMRIPEFTCLCPKTGQPDFATFHLEYVPDRLCVELKSLKLYMWSYRDQGAFHEAVTNRILDDLARATRPRFLRLTAEWYVRGGHLHHGRGRAAQEGLEGPARGDPALSRGSRTRPADAGALGWRRRGTGSPTAVTAGLIDPRPAPRPGSRARGCRLHHFPQRGIDHAMAGQQAVPGEGRGLDLELVVPATIARPGVAGVALAVVEHP